jgi:hypothetical protein
MNAPIDNYGQWNILGISRELGSRAWKGIGSEKGVPSEWDLSIEISILGLSKDLQ